MNNVGWGIFNFFLYKIVRSRSILRGLSPISRAGGRRTIQLFRYSTHGPTDGRTAAGILSTPSIHYTSLTCQYQKMQITVY